MVYIVRNVSYDVLGIIETCGLVGPYRKGFSTGLYEFPVEGKYDL